MPKSIPVNQLHLISKQENVAWLFNISVFIYIICIVKETKIKTFADR